MSTKNKTFNRLIVILILLVIISSCSSPVPADDDSLVTPTPTEVISEAPATPEIPSSPCEGRAWEIEVQVLVGPADAVGLSPHSVGSIPFSATTDEIPFLVEGGGDLDYGEILVEDWGTYEVTMHMQFTINGECVESDLGGELHLVLEMTGSQLVEVTSPDFHGEYPWEGSMPFDILFPLEEGASIEGEGFAFILHIN